MLHSKVKVTRGQVDYQHLFNKLRLGDPERYLIFESEIEIKVYAVFDLVDSQIES